MENAVAAEKDGVIKELRVTPATRSARATSWRSSSRCPRGRLQSLRPRMPLPRRRRPPGRAGRSQPLRPRSSRALLRRDDFGACRGRGHPSRRHGRHRRRLRAAHRIRVASGSGTSLSPCARSTTRCPNRSRLRPQHHRRHRRRGRAWRSPRSPTSRAARCACSARRPRRAAAARCSCSSAAPSRRARRHDGAPLADRAAHGDLPGGGALRRPLHGREAHASAAPWEGVNAQDALTVAQVAIGVLRQQLPPGDQVHGVVTESPAPPTSSRSP